MHGNSIPIPLYHLNLFKCGGSVRLDRYLNSLVYTRPANECLHQHVYLYMSMFEVMCGQLDTNGLYSVHSQLLSTGAENTGRDGCISLALRAIEDKPK